MTRTVFCQKYQQELPALEIAPLPGAKGEHVLNHISAKAWQEWLAHQTRLINEKHLSLFDPSSRKYLSTQMENFFNGGELDTIEGYVPETPGPDAQKNSDNINK
ncbi:oxidative damage protection protein [Marinagarivorans algicola]|uniref:oxidative damage protection protein n=1 Tax=Marinagarivorans algicola TaxID=1513270 RepID=UPI0006B9F30C|nr:oxidative damage protection protein [Marinagarivorans algicola]